MGRQQKEHAENWSAVGYVPKQFKQPYKKNTGKPGETKEEKPEEAKKEGENKEEVKPAEKAPEVKHEVKPEVKAAEHKKVFEHKAPPFKTIG